METKEKQKLWAFIEHEIVPGLTEHILLHGTIDGSGTISWDDPHRILTGKCKFIAINLEKYSEVGDYIDAQ